MSWNNCDICGKFKLNPAMVVYDSISGQSICICKFCQEVGQKEMDRAVDWLPHVDYSKVQDSVSVDISKDRIPVRS